MAESTAAFPYETRLNILHGPLELIDVKALADACEFKWFNQTLCQVNGSVVRVGVFEGEYHWHKHDEDDEFFYVLEGVLLIDLEERGPQRQVFVDGVQGRVVELAPGQGFVVPRGAVHRTRAQQRTVVLMVENAGIIPTGN
jgi:mannose-6-phosphate isomerase-like protein (cupin superfamily)